MASIQKRLIHGRPYYYLVESRRVQGKPRPVVLKYLGRAEDLLSRLHAAETTAHPIAAQVRDCGAVVALWDLAQQLQLIGIIDAHVPKRHQGPTVGEYLILAAINRCVAPTSKRAFAQWYTATSLPRLCKLSPNQLTSQRFWDHMTAVGETAIEKIEADISARLRSQFDIDVRCLCFDCTNFDTFIETPNPARLPQRGHAKSKRRDLRVVGLALMVSTDFHVPLFSQIYPGNQHDAVTFASVTHQLVERYRRLAQEATHITLVFDKGNNSQDNLQALADSPYHVIGSLVPSQHPELLAIPLSRFEGLANPRLEGVVAYRTRAEVFGREWTVVVTRSDTLLEAQLRGIAQQLRTRRQSLATLQQKIRRSQATGARGKGYTRESLEKHLTHLQSGQYMRDILSITVHASHERLKLTYRTNQRAFEDLIQTRLGKRILFTDNHDWSTEEIILGYRSQHHVEAAFRQMKDPHFVSWKPLYHWTDQKIRVHAFYCVLALILSSLLHRQVVASGMALSLERILTELSAIQEIVNLYPSPSPKGGRPRSTTLLTRLTPVQEQLSRTLGLDRYRPI